MPPIDQEIPSAGPQSLGAVQVRDSNALDVQLEKVAFVTPEGAWVHPITEDTGQRILAAFADNSRLLALIAGDLPQARV